MFRVLNSCPANHAKIIKRHDDIKEFVSGKLQAANHTVLVEQIFQDQTTTAVVKLRLDIVTVKQGKVSVVDTAVTNEQGDALRDVSKGKIQTSLGVPF